MKQFNVLQCSLDGSFVAAELSSWITLENKTISIDEKLEAVATIVDALLTGFPVQLYGVENAKGNVLLISRHALVAALRAFMNNEVCYPNTGSISSLIDCYYSDMPSDKKKQLREASFTLYTIYDSKHTPEQIALFKTLALAN